MEGIFGVVEFRGAASVAERVCEACGVRFEQVGPGKPRRWCPSCVPSLAAVGSAERSRAARRVAPGRHEAEKRARRWPLGWRPGAPWGEVLAVVRSERLRSASLGPEELGLLAAEASAVAAEVAHLAAEALELARGGRSDRAPRDPVHGRAWESEVLDWIDGR